MEIAEIAQALSSKTRVRLLHIVSKRSMTSSDAHEQYQEKYSSPTRRESIYRELENLVDSGLVTKEYRGDQKELVYTTSYDGIYFDIPNMDVEMS